MSRRRKSSWTSHKPWYKRLCRTCKGTGYDPRYARPADQRRARAVCPGGGAVCPDCRGFGW